MLYCIYNLPPQHKSERVALCTTRGAASQFGSGRWFLRQAAVRLLFSEMKVSRLSLAAWSLRLLRRLGLKMVD